MAASYRKQHRLINSSLKLLHHFWRTVGDITAERFYRVLAAFQEEIKDRERALEGVPLPLHLQTIGSQAPISTCAAQGQRLFDNGQLAQCTPLHTHLEPVGNETGAPELQGDRPHAAAVGNELFTNYYDWLAGPFGPSVLAGDMETDAMDFSSNSFTVSLSQWGMLDATEFNF